MHGAVLSTATLKTIAAQNVVFDKDVVQDTKSRPVVSSIWQLAAREPMKSHGFSLVGVLVIMTLGCTSLLALHISYVGVLKQYQQHKRTYYASQIASETYHFLQSRQGYPDALSQPQTFKQEYAGCEFSIQITPIATEPLQIQIDISWLYLGQEHQYQIQGTLGPSVGYVSPF